MTVIPKEPAWRPGEHYREDQPEGTTEFGEWAKACRDLIYGPDPAPINPAPESLKGKADERPVKSRQAVKATLPPREQLEPPLTHRDDFKP